MPYLMDQTVKMHSKIQYHVIMYSATKGIWNGPYWDLRGVCAGSMIGHGSIEIYYLFTRMQDD